MLQYIKEAIVYFLHRKETKDMAVIYATLILKGVKNYSDVPERIKDQVKQVLIDLECEHLITE